MFKQAKNIDTAFRYVRTFTAVVVAGCFCVSAYAIYATHAAEEKAQDRIFILANGKALEAYAAERRDNIPVEARDHVKMFHHYFFSLDPDEKVVQSNITKALYLADGSAKQQYDNLRENGYYTNLISGNISQEVSVDSIYININVYPFYFSYRGKQKIIRPTTIVTRSLLTEGYIRNVSRSDHNPHGFLIEKWRTLENNDLTTQSR